MIHKTGCGHLRRPARLCIMRVIQPRPQAAKSRQCADGQRPGGPPGAPEHRRWAGLAVSGNPAWLIAALPGGRAGRGQDDRSGGDTQQSCRLAISVCKSAYQVFVHSTES